MQDQVSEISLEQAKKIARTMEWACVHAALTSSPNANILSALVVLLRQVEHLEDMIKRYERM